MANGLILGLMAYWPLTDATDARHSHDLTNTGVVTFEASDLVGGEGLAVFVQGSSQALTVAQDAEIELADSDWTLGFVANITIGAQTPAESTVLDQGDSAVDSTVAVRIDLSDGTLTAVVNNAQDTAGVTLTRSEAFEDEVSRLVVLRYVASTRRVSLFIDGSLVAGATLSGTGLLAPDDDYTVGASITGDFGTIKVGSHWIAQRAWSDTEVALLWNDGTPLPFALWDAGEADYMSRFQSTRELAEVVIPNGETDSEELSTGGSTACGLQFPAAMDGATLALQASLDGGDTWSDVQDAAGNPIVVTVTASAYTPLDPAVFTGIPLLKFVSASTESDDRTLLVVMKPS